MPARAGPDQAVALTIEPVTIPYATHPTRRGEAALCADLYLPPDRDRPADLVTWLHSGGFRTGSRRHRNHARIAAEFARHGIAAAFIDYRLARPPAVLRRRTAAALASLVAEAEAAGEEMHPTFYGPRALAVVEDCCAFLAHAATLADRFGLSGRMLLAGSSAGAISALNTLYLPATLGLDRPPVATVLAFSGGFAYPSRVKATGARILALHSPGDTRVPVSSIRRLAAHTPDPMLLVEAEAQRHGEPTLHPAEPLAEAVARLVAFDRAEAPLTLPFAAPQEAGRC